MRSANRRRHLSFSEGDFEVFRPAVATRCTDRGEMLQEGINRRSSSPNFTPIGTGIGVQDQWRKRGPQFGVDEKKICRPPNSEIWGGGTARNSLFLGTKQLNIQ